MIFLPISDHLALSLAASYEYSAVSLRNATPLTLEQGRRRTDMHGHVKSDFNAVPHPHHLLSRYRKTRSTWNSHDASAQSVSGIFSKVATRPRTASPSLTELNGVCE